MSNRGSELLVLPGENRGWVVTIMVQDFDDMIRIWAASYMIRAGAIPSGTIRDTAARRMICMRLLGAWDPDSFFEGTIFLHNGCDCAGLDMLDVAIA